MQDINYVEALYRRDNNGNPCIWYIKAIGGYWYEIHHGILGKTISKSVAISNRENCDSEIQSKINEKRKQGYKYLYELKDNAEVPVEGELMNYLNTYLPYVRESSNGALLPMLAKTFDNTNNKVFKKIYSYYGQWKINGLRCFITACEKGQGLFRENGLRFQSREGTYWKGLIDLEAYLLNIIPKELYNYMLEYGWALDGEIYLPGYSVNEINHFVKDPLCPEHRKLQFWCYDIAINDTIQKERFDILSGYLNNYCEFFTSKNSHLNNNTQFVLLPLATITSETTAIIARDKFIDLGFEGLIMRNPNAEYEYGSRKANVMIKYKRATDGKFLIVDVIPEGLKRPDIPLFICKNDINDAKFECHVGGDLEYQKSQFTKDNIGKYMFIEYGERSGVEQVPFHVKKTLIIK